MATYTWSLPEANTITGLTYIKDTDNKLQATMEDLQDFVNGEGTHDGQGLAYDFLDKQSTQTATGVKTFSNGIISNVTGNVSGNAGTATRLATTRNISLVGDVTGTVSFDGSANVSMTTEYNTPPVPAGVIVMWSGSIASIPSGWYLCDGTNGTPNLTDRFIVGAGSTYSVNVTGGSKDAVVVSHSHTVSGTTTTDGSHTHKFNTYNHYNGQVGAAGGHSTNYGLRGTTTSAGSHNHTVSGTTNTVGESGTDKNLPPYLALAYIMKA